MDFSSTIQYSAPAFSVYSIAIYICYNVYIESTEVAWHSGDCAGRNNKRKVVHSKHDL